MVKNTSGKLWARKNAGKLIKERCLTKSLNRSWPWWMLPETNKFEFGMIYLQMATQSRWYRRTPIQIQAHLSFNAPAGCTLAQIIVNWDCLQKIRQGTKQTRGLPKISVLLALGLAAIKPPYGWQNQTTGTHCLGKREQWNHNIMFD